jgi:CubicO group peptidase (beta-lactamase class C family)
MSSTLTASQETAIDELLFDWLADTGVPGTSLVVVDESEEQYATGIGSRNLDDNDAATPDTLYGFASVTKSVTALAVLQQVEAGAIGLDDSIAEYTEADFDGVEAVTVHQLLTHSSGLPSLGTSGVLLARLADLGEMGIPLADEQDMLHLVDRAGSERDETSRGRFMYNNTAYTLLEWAVESTSGETFPSYVGSNILDPLGMERSTFDGDTFESDPDHATPYHTGEDGFEPTGFPARELSRGPGGLISSPREMGQYLQCNLGSGEYEGTRLVESDLLARAHEAHVEPLPRYGDGYGYGWMRREVAGTDVVFHGGSLLTSAAAIGFVPAEGVGVALACGAQPEIHPTEIFEGVVAILRETSPREAVPTLAYHDAVDELTGSYTGYRDIVSATVEDEGGHLSVSLSSGPIDQEYVLVPDDPTLDSWEFTATAPGRPTPVEFVATEAGVDLFLDRYRLHKTD